MKITLTTSEIYMAATAGMLRQIEAIAKKSPSAHGDTARNDWQLHLEGALGEMAMAKVTGRYWGGKGVKKALDVGDFEVRTSQNPKGYLPLHKNDKDDARYYFLIGKNGTYEIKGYILGKEGKDEKYWCDKYKKNRPAYFIPQSDLHKPVGGILAPRTPPSPVQPPVSPNRSDSESFGQS